MNKQAWIDIGSEDDSKSQEIGLCDLNKTLSLFEEFHRGDRARCPTLEEIDAEGDGEGPFDHDHLDFDVFFGCRDPESQEHSKCYLSVSALKPSGYSIHLTLPRYWMGCIPIPTVKKGFSANEGEALSRYHVVKIIQALFLRPDKELGDWAQSQSFLERDY